MRGELGPHTVEEGAAESVSGCHCWFLVIGLAGLGLFSRSSISRELKGQFRGTKRGSWRLRSSDVDVDTSN